MEFNEINVPDSSRELLTQGVEPDYNYSQLEKLISSPQWHQLLPNLPSLTALIPRELSVGQINEIVKSATTLQAMKAYVSRQKTDTFSIDVPGIGKLEKTGPGGESNICFLLTAFTGRKMAVLLGGYHGLPQIPDDPQMHLIKDEYPEELWIFSDLRTNLCLPFRRPGEKPGNGTIGITFQEYGGNSHLPFLPPGLEQLTRSRIANYARHRLHGPRIIVSDELRKPEHHLINGFRLPAVIAVNVSHSQA